MRLHAQHLNVTLKPQRSKLPPKQEELSIERSLARPHCSGITIAFNEELHDDSVRSLPAPSGSTASIIDTNDSIFACDIIELLCENSNNANNNDGTTCPQISSSTELQTNVYSTCKDCTECQLQRQQQQSNTIIATIHPETKETLMSGQDAELAKHFDSYEDDIGREASTLGVFVSTGHEEAPILVDLTTSEESKQAIWEQILRQSADAGENSEMGEEAASTTVLL